MHAYSPSSRMLMLTGRVVETSHLEILGTGLYPNECMIEGTSVHSRFQFLPIYSRKEGRRTFGIPSRSRRTFRRR